MEFAGIELLREYKAYTKISEISTQMDAWNKTSGHLWIRTYDMSVNAQVDVLEYLSKITQDRERQGP